MGKGGLVGSTHGRRRNFSKEERFFLSERGTTKNDSGRGTILETQSMGREGVKIKKKICRWRFLEKQSLKKEYIHINFLFLAGNVIFALLGGSIFASGRGTSF